MPKLDILFKQVKHPVLGRGYTFFGHWKKRSQRSILYYLTVGLYC